MITPEKQNEYYRKKHPKILKHILRWKPEEEKILKELFFHKKVRDIAKILGRTEQSARRKATELGLGKKSRGIIVMAEENPNWKGNNVGYTALHSWIKRRLPKPALCNCCEKELPRDLANISQEYKRTTSDWEWLCRKCHMKKDGRGIRLAEAHMRAVRNGTCNNKGRRKLTCEQVIEARKLREKGIPYYKIAKEFGVQNMTIWKVINEGYKNERRI